VRALVYHSLERHHDLPEFPHENHGRRQQPDKYHFRCGQWLLEFEGYTQHSFLGGGVMAAPVIDLCRLRGRRHNSGDRHSRQHGRREVPQARSLMRTRRDPDAFRNQGPPEQPKTSPDLGFSSVERVPGIEPALSAWESERSIRQTWPDLRAWVSGE